MSSEGKRIAISQPTYLPWIGYFDLIDQVDTFVFLDTVQFEKQSWQQRNRIKTPTGLQWLTVPVVFRGRFGQSIQAVELCKSDALTKHLRGIELNYRRAPFFGECYPQLEVLLSDAPARLSDLNMGIIRWACDILGMKTQFVKASELPVTGTRTELLAGICMNQRAGEYLSPMGSYVYLLDERAAMESKGIEILFQHYIHPEYRQMFGAFVPHACFLDLLFNEGPRSGEIIRSGRRQPFTPQQIVDTHAAKAQA
jgi:hypothetical protein